MPLLSPLSGSVKLAACAGPTVPAASSSSSGSSSSSKKKCLKVRRLLARVVGTALSESLPEISIASANMVRDLMGFKLQRAALDTIDMWSSIEALIVDALERREIKDCVLSLIELLETVESVLEGVGRIAHLDDLRAVLVGFRDKHLAPSSSREENSLTTKVAVLTITSCLLLTLVSAVKADRLELQETRLSSALLAERQALYSERMDALLRKNRNNAREILRLQSEAEEHEEGMRSREEMLRKQERQMQILEDQLAQRHMEDGAAHERGAPRGAASAVDMTFHELLQQGEGELARHESSLTEALARVKAAREQVALQRKEGSSEESRCVICLEKGKEILLLPCKHLCCCSSCILSLARNGCAYCPLCRNAVQQTIRVYS